MLTEADKSTLCEADYHARLETSRSQLATFAQSRRLYEATYITHTATEDDGSDALTIGTGAHAISLKDAIELNKIVVIPKSVLSKSGSVGTDACRAFKEAHAGKTLIKEDQLSFCKKLAAAVETEIGSLIHAASAQRERTVLWSYRTLELRCRLDVVVPIRGGICEPPWNIPHNLILDLKTAASIEQWAWWRAVRDRRLWLQDAFYSAGLEQVDGQPSRFAFVAVEKKEPYRVRMIELSEADRAAAKRRTFELLDDLIRCQQTGDYSEDGEGVITTMNPLGELR